MAAIEVWREEQAAAPEAPARIDWRDPDTGEPLWLLVRGPREFLAALARAGFDLQVEAAAPAPRPR
jgi:hypothetical protein